MIDLSCCSATPALVQPFPILQPKPDHPIYVPFGLVEEAAEQCRVNHGQTPQRLAERGGLSLFELAAVLTRRPFRAVAHMQLDEAEAVVTERVKAYLARLEREG